MIAAIRSCPVLYPQVNLNSTDSEKIGIQKIDIESVTFSLIKMVKLSSKKPLIEGIALTPQQTSYLSQVSPVTEPPLVQELTLILDRCVKAYPYQNAIFPTLPTKRNVPASKSSTNPLALSQPVGNRFACLPQLNPLSCRISSTQFRRNQTPFPALLIGGPPVHSEYFTH